MEDQSLLGSIPTESLSETCLNGCIKGAINPLRTLLDKTAKIDDLRVACSQAENCDDTELLKEAQNKILQGDKLEEEMRQLMVSCLEKKVGFSEIEKAEQLTSTLRDIRLTLADESMLFLQMLAEFMCFFSKSVRELKIQPNGSRQEGLEKVEMIISEEKLSDELELQQLESLQVDLLGLQELATKLPCAYECFRQQVAEIGQSLVNAVWHKKASEIVLHYQNQQSQVQSQYSQEHSSSFAQNMSVMKFNEFLAEAPKHSEKAANLMILLVAMRKKYDEFLELFQAVELFVRSKYSAAVPVTDGISPLMYAADERILAVLVEDTECLAELKCRFGELNEIFKAVPLTISSELRSKQQLIQKVITRIEQFKGNNTAKQGQAQYLLELESSKIDLNSVLNSQSSSAHQPSSAHPEEQIEGTLALRRANNELASMREQPKEQLSLPAHKKLSVTAVISLYETYKELQAKQQKVGPQLAEIENYLKMYQTEEFALLKLSKEWIARINEPGLPLKQFRADFDAIVELKKKSIFQWNKYEDNIKGLEVILRLREALEGWNGGTSWKSAGEIQNLLSTLGERNYVVRSYEGRSLFTSKLEELASIRSELSKLNQDGITCERLEEMSKILANSFVSCTVEKQRVNKMKAARENILCEMNEWNNLKTQGKRVTLARIQGTLEQLKASGVRMEEKKLEIEGMIDQAQGLQKAVKNARTVEEYIINEYNRMHIEIEEVEEILKESAELNNWLSSIEGSLCEGESDQSHMRITSDYEQLLELSIQLDGVKERYLENSKLKNLKEKVFALLAVLVADNWRINQQLTGFTQNSLNQLHHQAKQFLKDDDEKLKGYQLSKVFAQMRRSLFGQKENMEKNGEKVEIELERGTEQVQHAEISKKEDEEEELVDMENMIHLDKHTQESREDVQLEEKQDMEEVLMEIELEAGDDQQIGQYEEKELQEEEEIGESKQETTDESLISLIVSSILARRDAMDTRILLECALLVEELWEEMAKRVKEIKAVLTIEDMEQIESNGYGQLGCVDLSDVLIEQKSLIQAKQDTFYEETQTNLRNDINSMSSQKGKKQAMKLKEKEENSKKSCRAACEDSEIKQTPQKKIKEKKKNSDQKQSSAEGKSLKKQSGKKQQSQNKEIQKTGEQQEEIQVGKGCLDDQIKKNLDFSEETTTTATPAAAATLVASESISKMNIENSEVQTGSIADKVSLKDEKIADQKLAIKESQMSTQKQQKRTKQSQMVSAQQNQEISSFSPYNSHSSAQKTSESSPEQQQHVQQPKQQIELGIVPEKLQFESNEVSIMVKNLSEREWLVALDDRHKTAGKEIMRYLVSNLHFGETRLCFEIIERVVQNYVQRIIKTASNNGSSNSVEDKITQIIAVVKSLHNDPSGSKELRSCAFSYDCLMNLQKKITNEGESEKQKKIRKQQQLNQQNDSLKKKRRLNDDWLFDGEEVVKSSNGNDKENIEHEEYFKSESEKFSYTQYHDPETRELNKLLSSKDVLMQFRRMNEASKRNRGMCISVDSEIQDTRMDLTDEEDDDEDDDEGNNKKAQKAMFSSDDEDDAIETYYPSVAKYGRDKKTKKLMDPIKEDEMESFVKFCKSQVKAANQKPTLFNPLEKGTVEDALDNQIPIQQPQSTASNIEQIFTVFKGKIHLRVEANYQPIKAICYAETLRSQVKQIPVFQFGQTISQNGESDLPETRSFLLKSFCSPAIVALFGIVETEQEEEQNIINSLAQDLKNRERVSIALWSTAAKVYFFPRRLFDGFEMTASKIAAKLTNSPTELCFAVVFKTGSLTQVELEQIPKISNPPCMSIQTFAELQALRQQYKREEQSNLSSQSLRMAVMLDQGKNDKSNEKQKIKKNQLRKDPGVLPLNSEMQAMDQKKNPLNLLLMPSNCFEVQRTLKQIEDRQEFESNFRKASSIKDSKYKLQQQQQQQNQDAHADVEAFFQRKLEGRFSAKQQRNRYNDAKLMANNFKQTKKIEITPPTITQQTEQSKETAILAQSTQGISKPEDTQHVMEAEETIIENPGQVRELDNLQQSPIVASENKQESQEQEEQLAEGQTKAANEVVEEVVPSNNDSTKQAAVEDKSTEGVVMEVEETNKQPTQQKQVLQSSIAKNRQKILEFSSILDKLKPSAAEKACQDQGSDENALGEIKQEEPDGQNEQPQLEEEQQDDKAIEAEEKGHEEQVMEDQVEGEQDQEESNEEEEQQNKEGSNQRFSNSKKWLTPQQQQHQKVFRMQFDKENDPEQSPQIIHPDFQSLNRSQQLLQLQMQKQMLQQQRGLKQQQHIQKYPANAYEQREHEEQDGYEYARSGKQQQYRQQKQYLSNESRFSMQQQQYPYSNNARQPFTNRYNQGQQQQQQYAANHPNKQNNLSYSSYNSNFVKQSNPGNTSSIAFSHNNTFQQGFQPQQYNPLLFSQMNAFAANTNNNNNRMLSLLQPPVPPQPQQPARQQLQPHQQFMKNHLVRYDSQSNVPSALVGAQFSQQLLQPMQYQPPRRPMIGQTELRQQDQPLPILNTKSTESSLLGLRDQLDSLLSVIQIKQRVYGLK